MEEKKYNKVLTVILIVVVAAIFIVLGFWGYDLYQKYYINASANQALDEFDNRVTIRNITKNETVQENVSLQIDVNQIESTNTATTGNMKNLAKQTYKGFTVVGKIEIPAIKANYPILDRATPESMKPSVGLLYGVGLNQVGNTVIAGHNYRNGTFFSNNKNLQLGDVVYITDLDGNRIKYTIYNIYVTASNDFEYATRDTAGKREITLTTCTDDVNSRLVIWAKED